MSRCPGCGEEPGSRSRPCGRAGGCWAVRPTPELEKVLSELQAMEAIARALEPLSPRMRAATLAYAKEYLADKAEHGQEPVPELENTDGDDR